MFDYINFSFEKFASYVIEKMKLGSLSDEMKLKFETEISKALADRIITTMVNAMTEENLQMYDRVKQENPDFTTVEAIMIIVDEIPELHEVLIRNVNDLAEELTFNADQVEQALAKRDAKNEAEKTA